MKKVLAWAVALALVLSSFTMAFAADAPNSSQFSDADQIQYTEAVDVMVATGIINGYPDGTFGPAKTVKRSEMAKMIAVMMNGGEDIGDQFKGACPFADSKDHWAAGYIAYCAGEHIIDGRSADVFDPEAEVTGTEVAKMALTSLGYDSQIQGYVGENWAAAVLKDAKKNGLFDGLAKDFVPGDPCTREAAAQILFNALQATEVEYSNNTTVEVGDAKVSVNSKVQEVKAGKEDLNGNETLELYEDVFGGDLVKKDTTDNGKPAHKWTYNKDNVGTYPDDADISAVADDAESDVAQFVKDATDDDEATVATVTTEDEETGDVTTEKQIYLNGVVNETATIEKGDSVELFETDVDGAYKVVIMRYVADRIEEVNTDVKSKDAEDGVYAYVTFENAGTFNDDKIVGFDKATYVEDAVIAVATKGAVAKADIIDSYVIEKETTGTWSKDYSAKMTVDGTSFDKIGTGVVNFGSAASGDDVDLYLINDYAAAVVKVSEDEADTVYGILLATGSADMSDGNGKYKILDASGSVATYEVDETADGVSPAVGDVIAYSINDDKTIDVTGAYNSTTETGIVGLSKDSMSSKSLMKGYEVLQSVAIYDYAGEDTTQAELQKADNYTVFGYSDLADAEVSGFAVLNADGDIAAIYTTEGLTSTDTETFVAIYGSKENATNGEDPIYDVELFVNGESKNYDTVDRDVEKGTFENGNVVLVTVNADGAITKIEVAKEKSSETIISEFEDSYDYVVFANNGEVTAKDGNKLTVGKYKINIEGAAIYKWTTDNKIDADNYTKSEITAKTETSAGDNVYVYQFSEGSETWDVVVIGNPLTAGTPAN